MKLTNVTLKKIRAFVAIAKTHSFAEAGELIHLSQPALSISIKNLEETIGGKLFIRSTRTLALTPEGEVFFPIAQQLLADWDGAFDDLNDLFSLKRGKLIIAAMPSFASTELPHHIKKFRQQYPKITIKIHDVIAEDTIAMVQTGRVELALTFDPNESDDLQFEPLFTDHFVAALPVNHPLLIKKIITWQALAKHPFIALQRPSSIRHLIESSLTEKGIELNVEFETNQLATIGQMVATGLGVSAMPSLYLKQLQAQGVECRPLSQPTVSRRVGIVTRRRYPLSSAAHALVELIRNEYKTD
jgi:LysR family carnitine catabolism transcriptional activator